MIRYPGFFDREGVDSDCRCFAKDDTDGIGALLDSLFNLSPAFERGLEPDALEAYRRGLRAGLKGD